MGLVVDQHARTVPGGGLEPPLLESKSRVLPLDDPGIIGLEGFEPSCLEPESSALPIELQPCVGRGGI
jgi:hypothetical protein